MSLNPDFPPRYFHTFPWLNGSDSILFNYMGFTPEKLHEKSIVDIVSALLEEFPDLPSRILAFFHAVADSQESFSTPTDDIVHLAMYPLIQIIISMLGNRIMANALSNMYAKHCQDTLGKHNSQSNYSDQVLQKFCENLGIQCSIRSGKTYIEGKKYPFMMHFASYLETATKIKDQKWKLINNLFIDGYVYLIRYDIVMLLREFARNKTKPDFSNMDDDLREQLEGIPKVKSIIADINEIIAQNTHRFQGSILSDGETVGSELFPPCIQYMLARSNQGENLSHNERLALAFFYLNTNHTIEETVDIFRTSPDFSETIARYQVEFAAGKGTSGTKYSMFKCAKLKSLHLCRATDPQFGNELCVKGGRKRNGEYSEIKNPAYDFIFWRKVQLKYLHRQEVQRAEKELEKKDSDTPDSKKSPQKSSRSRISKKKSEKK